MYPGVTKAGPYPSGPASFHHIVPPASEHAHRVAGAVIIAERVDPDVVGPCSERRRDFEVGVPARPGRINGLVPVEKTVAVEILHEKDTDAFRATGYGRDHIPSPRDPPRASCAAFRLLQLARSSSRKGAGQSPRPLLSVPGSVTVPATAVRTSHRACTACCGCSDGL